MAVAGATAWLLVASRLWDTDVPNGLQLQDVDEDRLFAPGVLERTERYERFLRWNGIASLAVLVTVLALYAWRGYRFARESAAGRIGTGMLLGMIGLALVWIAQLPFTLADIWWQRRHDLVEAEYLEWLLENWLSLGAEFLFICLWLLITMTLAAVLRDRWWLAAAPVFTGLAVFFAFLSPYLVPDQRDPGPAQVADARSIARATGQEGVELKVQEISDLTKAPNAFAAGVGPTRRVVLWDTLLESPFDRSEVRVVIAHEYGHHASNHIWKSLAWFGLLSLPVLGIVALVTRRCGGIYTPRAVPVALFALVLLSVLTQPFTNLVTRRMEVEADWVALETTREPAEARELFEGFTEVALVEPDPPEWAHLLFDSHPSIVDRIAAANAWERVKTADSGNR